jgi:hypothetical protein
MNSKWRNKINKINKTKNTVENFTQFNSIHLMEKSKDTQQTFKEMFESLQSNQNIKEGFDWQGKGYYNHKGEYTFFEDFAKILADIIKNLQYILNKSSMNLDSEFEKMIYDFLLILNPVDCSDNEIEEPETAKPEFVWYGNTQTRSNDEIDIPNLRGVNFSQPNIESFASNIEINVSETINSFFENHEKLLRPSSTLFTDETKYITTEQLTDFYNMMLNKYRYNVNDFNINGQELLDFNNYFDSILNDPNIISTIHKTLKTTANIQFYSADQVGYNDYKVNDRKIWKDSFNTFSIKIFEGIIEPTDEDMRKTHSQFTENGEDYSIQLTESTTTNKFSNFHEYIEYITKYLALGYFISETNTNTSSELTILDVQKVIKTNYEPLYEVVIFLCFYSIVCKDKYWLENLKDDNVKNKFVNITNILNDYFFTILTTNSSDTNSSDTKKKKNMLSNILLNSTISNYLITAVSEIKFYSGDGDNTIVDEINDVADGIQPSMCPEKQQRKSILKKYAKLIKNEIYNILFIPIIIYLIYNVFFMFFYKDFYYDTTTGKLDDKYKIPLFPDIESYFHKYEEYKTNMIFEHIFKPTKTLYTILNSIKMIYYFVLNYIPPYFFLFLSTVFVFEIYRNYGNKIADFYSSIFFNFEVPNITINSSADIPSQGRIKIVTYFIILIYFSYHTLCSISKSLDLKPLFISSLKVGTVFEKTKLIKPRTWLKFFLTYTNGRISLVIIGIVILYLYYCIKYYATFALLPLSLLILFIYLFVYMLLAIPLNLIHETDISKNTTYSEKVDTMFRIIFNDLFDDKKHSVWNGINAFFSHILFFLSEIIAVIILLLGLFGLKNRINDPKYGPGINLSIEILYIIIFCILGLWSGFKYFVGENNFENTKKRYETTEKLGYFENANKSIYEKIVGGDWIDTFRIFFYSDEITEEYLSRTKPSPNEINQNNKEKTSFLSRISNMMPQGFGKKVGETFKKIRGNVDKISNNVSDYFKTDDSNNSI